MCRQEEWSSVRAHAENFGNVCFHRSQQTFSHSLFLLRTQPCATIYLSSYVTALLRYPASRQGSRHQKQQTTSHHTTMLTFGEAVVLAPGRVRRLSPWPPTVGGVRLLQGALVALAVLEKGVRGLRAVEVVEIGRLGLRALLNGRRHVRFAGRGRELQECPEREKAVGGDHRELLRIAGNQELYFRLPTCGEGRERASTGRGGMNAFSTTQRHATAW